MPEKQRGDIDLSYPNGFFNDTVTLPPVQLYQIYECEVRHEKILKPCIKEEGILIVLCVLGHASFRYGDDTIALQAGCAVVCSAKGEHIVLPCNAEGNVRCICMNLYCNPYADRSFNRSLYTLYAQPSLLWNVNRLKDTYRSVSLLIGELSSATKSRAMVRCLLDWILVDIYRGKAAVADADLLNDPTVTAVGHTVYAVIRYIDEHLYAMNNLMEMAQELGYSYNYLSHLFRKKTGMTIQAYVSQKKIERSTSLLLQSRYSITEIAAMLNYDCIQSFSKAFKKAMNMSPTEYRAVHGYQEY